MDQTFDEELLLLLLLRRKRKRSLRKKKTRRSSPRFWVRSIFEKRKKFGEYHHFLSYNTGKSLTFSANTSSCCKLIPAILSFMNYFSQILIRNMFVRLTCV